MAVSLISRFERYLDGCNAGRIVLGLGGSNTKSYDELINVK